ncbi:hypothetical protein Y032_0175g512 [Ancylostoma ceylanicum]|nr:hypothetical protein Y032_0175g512 [Ancylostoma ceylanicum]
MLPANRRARLPALSRSVLNKYLQQHDRVNQQKQEQGKIPLQPSIFAEYMLGDAQRGTMNVITTDYCEQWDSGSITRKEMEHSIMRSLDSFVAQSSNRQDGSSSLRNQWGSRRIGLSLALATNCGDR